MSIRDEFSFQNEVMMDNYIEVNNGAKSLLSEQSDDPSENPYQQSVYTELILQWLSLFQFFFLAVMPPVLFLLYPLKVQFSPLSYKPVQCAFDDNYIQTKQAWSTFFFFFPFPGELDSREDWRKGGERERGQRHLRSRTSMTETEPDESVSAAHMWTGERRILVCEDSWKIPLSLV